MKGIYLVAIFYVATLGVAALNESPVADWTKCPKDNPWNKTFFIPHENDCTKFYNCQLGEEGKPLDCPFMDNNGNRLHFNFKEQVCDWPWRAGCQVSSSTPTSSPTPITTPPNPPTPSTPPPTPPPTLPPTLPPSTPTPTTPSPSTPTPTTPPPSTPTPTTPSPSTPTPSTPPPSPPPTPPPSTRTPTTPSQNTPTTPSLDSCASDGIVHLLPHKNMCDHYYSCLNGRIHPIPEKCDRDLLFNSILRVCDFPENVDCSDTISPSTNVPSTIRSIVTTWPNPPLTLPRFPLIPEKSMCKDPVLWNCIPNGKHYKFPHETWCNYYYWCTDGNPSSVPIKCERDLLFNPVVGQCDYPENVNCCGRTIPPTPSPPTERTTPTTTTTTTTECPKTPPPPTKPTPTPTTTTTTECPKTPSPPTKPTPTPTTTTTTECPKTPPPPTDPTTPPTTTTTRDPNKPRETCPPKGTPEKARIAHPCLCNQYYECVNGEKELQACPIGKHFDWKKEICDWAAVVKCIRPIPTFDISTFDIQIDDHNIKCAPEGRTFQHKTDCSAYYSCSNGEKILKHCMEGLHFNMTIQTCDYPLKHCDLNRTRPIINLNFCPPPDSIEKVFLSHECECTLYYECVGGKKILRSCPNGLHFDRFWQICNDPTEVKCVAHITSTTPKIVSTTISTTKAIDKPRLTCPPKGSTERARLPHPCLCNQYYECVEGDKVLRICPIGKNFDWKKEICDLTTKVKCIRQLPSQNIPIGDYDTKCSPDGRTFQHEVSCIEYYLCSKGEKILKSCLEGLHFNVSLQMCDYPLKECDLTASLPTIWLDICPPAGSVEKVLLPHECGCTQYYECIDGKQILRDCSNGLHYDYIHQICNKPAEVKCANLASTVPTKQSSSTSDLGKCFDENSEIPHEYDCRSYYKCSNGEKILKTCPKNLYFNPKLQVCDFSENVACDAKPSNVPSMPTSSKCDTITGTTKIPHETDCNQYYVCENGVSTLKQCHSPDLVFNPILKICDFPENYICDVTRAKSDLEKLNKMIQNLDPSTCIGTCPEEDPEYAVLLPNDDCKKFCLCSNGLAYVQPCPEPLYFDSVQKICKRKKDAICGVRSYDQDNNLTINETVDDNNSVKTLTNENNEHETYDNLDPSTCIGTCPEEDPEYAILLPNDDCKKFCMCSGGVSWVQLCPDPLYFDSVQKVCKRKKDAVCAKRSFSQDDTDTVQDVDDEDNSVQISNEKSTEKRGTYNDIRSKPHFYNLDPSTCIGTCPEEDPEYAVLLPNDDCKKFCLCSNGLAYVQPCPEPLYFDSVGKVCKKKKDAVCAVRSFGRSFDRVFDEDDSEISLSEENYNGMYDNPWYKRRFSNVDPSTCLGICPDEDTGYTMLLPHQDCRKFCICSNGLAYVQMCPESLYFHSVDKVCRRKRHVVCTIDSFRRNHAVTINRKDDVDSIEFLSEEINNGRENHNYWRYRPHFHNFYPSSCLGSCSEDDSMYAVLHPHKDCKKFCLCNNGMTWIQSCPEPLYFDSIHKICKWEKDAICAVRTSKRYHAVTINKEINENDRIEFRSEESSDEREIYDSWSELHSYNLDTSTCIGTCSDESYDYAVVLPNLDCRKFCICSGGLAWVQPCPEPLYFDSINKICKSRRSAICAINMFNKNRPFMFKTIDVSNLITPLSEEKNHARRKRDNIRSRLHFSTQLFVTNLDPSTCIGTCPEEDPEYAVLLPNDDCKTFCMCSNGIAWVQPCPEPLYFDSVEKVCKKKKDAVCGVRSFNQANIFTRANVFDDDNSLKSLINENNNEHGTYNNLDPATCIGTCPEEDPEFAVLLPNDDCKKFCMCSNGIAWVQPCPEPLYFDSIEKVCKKKKDAVCGVRSFNQANIFTRANVFDDDNSLKSLINENNNEHGTYNNLDPATCIGTCPEEDPEYAVLLPNDDCKKFCMCSNGIAWVQPCPEPLYFDSVEKVCKKKKDAVCGVRSFNQAYIFTRTIIFVDDNLFKSSINRNNNEHRTYVNLDPATCIGTCPEEDPEFAVLLPNDDCKKFCMCSNGIAWVQPCPEPLYFDSVEKVCKKKKDAVCGVRSFNQANIFTRTIIFDDDNLFKSSINRNNNEHRTYVNLDPATCIGTCPEEDPEFAVLLPNDDCKKFCMCSNGIAWVQPCPEPLYFDSVEKVCKKKKDAVCGVRSYN